MAGIDHLIGPDEVVVYRARFGAMRVLYEAMAVAIGLGVGVLTGPGILLAILFLGVWFYSERGLQRIVVTNQRVIHKQGWIRPRVDEVALSQVESIKNNGQRIVIIGSGGTKLKLPAYIANEAGLGRAIRQGRMGPQGVAPQATTPVYPQTAEARGATAAPPTGDSAAAQAHASLQGASGSAPQGGGVGAEAGATAAGASPSKAPLWKRPAFVVIACLLGWPFLVIPFMADEDVPASAAGEVGAPSVQQAGFATAEAVASEPASVDVEAAPTDDPGALPEAVLTVTEADTLPYARRSIVVRLSDEIDEATIVEIGKLLQAEAPRYRSTYVDFYLPQMVEGAGAWASLHLERGQPPELLGLSDTSSLSQAAKAAGSGGDIIGKWRDDRPYVKSLMVIRETGAGALLTRTFADGEVMEQRLTERKASSGRRFDIVPEDGDGYGEYLVVRTDGALAFHDNDGLIFVARKAE
ncbi:hypothetical protein [Parvibaculum sp.]|uniref:hypothetical protein n=1 Tax=Parvibaculum sp. TaxID=2024848 RepID=UPI001B0F9F9B|nr:hypothetical protein [Parvibaculum sp.]MBO6668021.1 hypothetical protein [Parvibaculum sp.]MBO6693345.1 hypothetical protein [Parvibaculum sp.]